ncbi:MAG: HEPN domain-containing protein [Candidatus Acidulodesulfobacterium ferriphilum]|uniref:HEPN domain-containing protein n=1 Tax=Candidatus Acidulodesulfobacterium ferriphilum TaxID=2597223 RepID=A0A519B9S1_9DELT|nr:MAG: HEPN domain-containing protein [Candidatus Acidulodesulfobacterium ferriphilum]
MNRWKDWYNQGKRDFQKAKLDYDYKYYEWCCFTSQQGAEKTIKSLGLKNGVNLWGHSLTEMINILSDKSSRTKIEFPLNIKDSAKILDMFYIPSRYPDGFSTGKPEDYFSEKQAMEAINAANDIIKFCESILLQS